MTALVSESSPASVADAFAIALQSSPERLDLLMKISPEATTEAAGMLQLEGLQSLPCGPVSEYELVMGGDAVLSAASNSTVFKPGGYVSGVEGQGYTIANTSEKVQKQNYNGNFVNGKFLVSLSASLGAKQVLCLLGLGQSPVLWAVGFSASWAAKEVYDKSIGAGKDLGLWESKEVICPFFTLCRLRTLLFAFLCTERASRSPNFTFRG